MFTHTNCEAVLKIPNTLSTPEALPHRATEAHLRAEYQLIDRTGKRPDVARVGRDAGSAGQIGRKIVHLGLL